MTTKPASRLIAKALPRGRQFVGQFALPGLFPDLVRDKKGLTLFDNERDAEFAAMEAALRLYDSRTYDTRKAGGYLRLTGAELAALLNQLDITPTYAAEIIGVPQSRVLKWLDGEQDIPHVVNLALRMMALSKDNLALAEQITAESQRPE